MSSSSDECLEPCALPWVNFGTNPFGSSRICGYSGFKGSKKVQSSTISAEFNNDLFKEVRREFMAGRWPKNCERCRYMEELGKEQSKRQMNGGQIRRGGVADLVANTSPDGEVAYFPKQIDIRLGTVCNLKCIHCGTGNSSKWLEDEALIGKYENTGLVDVANIDNSWVDRDNPLWRDIFENLDQIEKFNFLGGEPFASRQHNRFLERAARTPYASKIDLHYVTNGTLLNEKMLDSLQRFKSVAINVSLDASGKALEFFRFPVQADALHRNLKMLEQSKAGVFDLRLQWTSSNVGIFYLDETLDYFTREFRGFKFYFCNFVDYPSQMSPQNLPRRVKEAVRSKLSRHIAQFPQVEFYLNHMDDRDLWPEQGRVLLNYLEDLSRARGIEWRSSLKTFAEAVGDG